MKKNMNTIVTQLSSFRKEEYPKGEVVGENASLPTTPSLRATPPSRRRGAVIATLRMATLFSVLCTLYSCTSESIEPSYAPITLTTPRIELGEVTASATSRSVIGAQGSAVDNAAINLYMLDAEGNQQGENSGYYSFTVSQWSTTPSNAPVVQNGPGQYYAGITAWAVFKKTDTMPGIINARYGYRGYITVDEEGTFTPGAPLTPMTAAVQVKLKDANGEDITVSSFDLSYLCSYDGLCSFNDYWYDEDIKKYPMGKNDPIILSEFDDQLYSPAEVRGGFTPGTYPATLTEVIPDGRGELSPVTPTAPWTLFTIHHSPDGFEWSDDARNYVPKGELFTWTVNYSGTLKLEAGKFYTFTITLGIERIINLSQDAVSIGNWSEGGEINIGEVES